MNPKPIKPPSLRRHATGQYMVTWGGQDHYLGHDPERANALYLRHLQDWAAWRAERTTTAMRPAVRRRIRIAEAVRMFLAAKEAGDRQLRRAYYAKHLARFLVSFADLFTDMLSTAMVQAVKDEMVKNRYGARTVNHDLTAIRAFVDWCANMNLCAPLGIRGVRKLPVGEPPDKTLRWAEVRGMIQAAQNLAVVPWLALSFLGLMRPSEVPAVVGGRGEFVAYGVFRLDKGKMDERSSWRRHVILSDEALRWLRVAEPRWSYLGSYSQAVRDDVGRGPGALRHTAATYLARAGVDRGDISLLLGHTPGRVALTYARISWPALREKVSLLTLAPVVSPVRRS